MIKDNGFKTRETALWILKEVNQDGRYANMSLKEALREREHSSLDKAFVTQLVYGTLERQITLDWVIARFAKRKRVNPWIMNILRMGSYQILYMDRVPDAAACNEAGKLAAHHGLSALQGFVNGILRNIARNKEKLPFPDPLQCPLEHLSLTYSFPLWMVEKWAAQYGLPLAEEMLKKPDVDDELSIRVNTLKGTSAELTDKLDALLIASRPGAYLPESLYIRNAGDIEENAFYHEGLFTVQGESSMLVTHLLDPAAGDKVLDACSSPGGKSTHIAARIGRTGRVTAWDIHPHRVDMVKSNAARMGVSEIVMPQLKDASKADEALIEAFDRVLIDAPCTGWGIIHKKPDIKLKVVSEGIQELAALQYAILSACSAYVKPGGVLIYSTCTMNKQENEKIVTRFLGGNVSFSLEDFEELLPSGLKEVYDGSGMLQLIPGRDGIDGFFVGKLRKRAHV